MFLFAMQAHYGTASISAYITLSKRNPKTQEIV